MPPNDTVPLCLVPMPCEGVGKFMQQGVGDDALGLLIAPKVMLHKMSREGDARFTSAATAQATDGPIPPKLPLAEPQFLQPALRLLGNVFVAVPACRCRAEWWNWGAHWCSASALLALGCGLLFQLDFDEFFDFAVELGLVAQGVFGPIATLGKLAAVVAEP